MSASIHFYFTSILTVHSLARVYPLVIHVYRLGQKVDGGLEILQTYCALNPSGVFTFVHFHLATFLVVTKRAGEHRVQSLDGFVLWWRLPLGLSATHTFITKI